MEVKKEVCSHTGCEGSLNGSVNMKMMCWFELQKFWRQMIIIRVLSMVQYNGSRYSAREKIIMISGKRQVCRVFFEAPQVKCHLALVPL